MLFYHTCSFIKVDKINNLIIYKLKCNYTISSQRIFTVNDCKIYFIVMGKLYYNCRNILLLLSMIGLTITQMS